MSVLDLFATIAWTLGSPTDACSLKVDRNLVEWCVDGACSPVQEVSETAPGQWRLEPQGVHITWTDWASASVPCGSTSSKLTVRWDAKDQNVVPEVPRAEVSRALGLPEDAVVPGRWWSATRDCVEGTRAWSFVPFGGRRALFVAREGGAWRVEPTKTAVPAMCPGGRYGGLGPDSVLP